MSLLDTIAGLVEKHPELTDEQHSGLVQHAMQMFSNHAAISQLLSDAQSQGMATLCSPGLAEEQISPLIQVRCRILSARIG